VDLAELNRLPPTDALEAFTACCGSTAWAGAMVERRPFGDLTSLLSSADEVWWDLTPDDWLEAFDAHPRIGESSHGDDTHSRWSRREQGRAADTDEATAIQLAECNATYEDRFGFTFVVFATGRTADEILDLCRRRLGNDEIAELTVAAGEQSRITNLRLRKLVGAV
jgi:OHCU decarboxylase